MFFPYNLPPVSNSSDETDKENQSPPMVLPSMAPSPPFLPFPFNIPPFAMPAALMMAMMTSQSGSTGNACPSSPSPPDQNDTVCHSSKLYTPRSYSRKYRSPDSGICSSTSSSSSSSSDSPLSSSSALRDHNTPLTGRKKDFCYLCNKDINKPGSRSQGPRRHILQFHMQRKVYQCSLCDHGSVYDRHHVISHMKRVHKDKPDHQVIIRDEEYGPELEMWYQKCFKSPTCPPDVKPPTAYINMPSEDLVNLSGILGGKMPTPPPLLLAEDHAPPTQQQVDHAPDSMPRLASPAPISSPNKHVLPFSINQLLN